MPKARKRKAAVTQHSSANEPTTSSTPRSSRTLIRRFHVLLKQQSQLQHGPPTPSTAETLAAIAAEIEALGGLSAYQQMSSIGQGSDRGGGSEKVFVGWLTELGWADAAAAHGKKHRLLEVGALKPDNYAAYGAWLDVHPIDLRSRHPSILEQDFLLMDAGEHREKWDLISLSLVVNFVADAKDRGRMLCLAHTMLRAEGMLFLALPLPCVANSRYTTPEHLTALMATIGFTQLRERWKPGGKMAYWVYQKTIPDANEHADRFLKKNVLRQGNRNNFCILL